jgi:putative ABC transport system permease protein
MTFSPASIARSAATLLGDLKVAIRSLRRAPALWITVALTLALGIGVNAAIFSVVRSVLWRPLVNRGEDRLIYIQQSEPGVQVDDATFSIPEITDIEADLKSISQIGTFSTVDFTAEGFGETRTIHGAVVDGSYFQVMGLSPVLGRLLDTRDDGQKADGAVVLTYKFWAGSLHSDPNVLGKVVRLGSVGGGRSAVVVGVLEPSIPYPADTEIIANLVTSPHHLSATMVQGREHRMTNVFGRLADGASLKAARAELRTVYATMVAAHPEAYKTENHFQIDARLLRDQINHNATIILYLLFGASGLLFVIACSNVANLFLARTVRRESELSIHAALGASSAALRRSLLAEGLVLCGSGGLAGMLVAAPMVAVLAKYALRYSVRAADLTVDFSALGMGLVLSLAAAVFLAFVPRLPSPDTSSGLGLTSSISRITRSRRRIRVFTVTQVAASFLLLASAGVLLKTLLTLQKAQPQFETARILTATLPIIGDGRTPEQVAEFYQQVQHSVRALPGVESASTGWFTPWRDSDFLTFTLQFAVEGGNHDASKDDLRARFRVAAPDYFATLGIPLLEGREFTDADKTTGEPVAIVSKSIAQKLFPGQDAIDRHVTWTDPLIKFIPGMGSAPRRIVGIIDDIDDANIIPQANQTIYTPFAQGPIIAAQLFVRTKTDPGTLIQTITKTIRTLAATQPVERPGTLQEVRTQVLANNRVNTFVFGGFAALALAISVVGVAGVLAFSVSWRTREFGIRFALGAQRGRILAGVLLDGLTIAAIGIAAGAIVGWGLSRLAGNYVPALQLPGPLPLIGAAAVIVVSAILASLVPAARAARINTVQALRAE